MADATESEEAGDEIPPEERPILVVDPDDALRARVESWEEEIGRPIRALDPALLAEELPESLADACAVVVSWDLGGRPGVDLVEHVAAEHPGLPVVLTNDQLSREQVEIALRRGATSVLLRPYEADALMARLGALPTSEEEAPEAEAASS